MFLEDGPVIGLSLLLKGPEMRRILMLWWSWNGVTLIHRWYLERVFLSVCSRADVVSFATICLVLLICNCLGVVAGYVMVPSMYELCICRAWKIILVDLHVVLVNLWCYAFCHVVFHLYSPLCYQGISDFFKTYGVERDVLGNLVSLLFRISHGEGRWGPIW